MRALVTGGRDFDDTLVVFGALLTVHGVSPITVLGHGDAPGADRLAAEWASLVGVPQVPYPAQWGLYGNLAGRVRNAQMLREFKPQILIRFPGGDGTAHMTGIAKRAGIFILPIDPERTRHALDV